MTGTATRREQASAKKNAPGHLKIEGPVVLKVAGFAAREVEGIEMRRNLAPGPLPPECSPWFLTAYVIYGERFPGAPYGLCFTEPVGNAGMGSGASYRINR